MLVQSAVSVVVQWAKAHSVTSTLLVATFVFFFLRWLLTRRKNFPPGPWGLPIVGYVPLMANAPFRRLDNLSKKYGDVFSLSLGGRPTVVLNSFSAVKEAYSNPVYEGRPQDSVFETFKEPGSPPSPDGAEWFKVRRFTLHMLKDLGLGKSSLEELMKEEVVQFLQEVKAKDGQPFYPRLLLMPSVANNISVLIFGKRFERGHQGMAPFTKPQEPTRLVCMCGVLMIIPFARTLMKLAIRFSGLEMFRMARLMENHIKNEFKLHKENMGSSPSHKDYIDGFLAEIEKHKGIPSNVAFTDFSLRENVQGLLGAGTETVLASMEWACLIMAANPDIQRRVQNEIDEVVGRERLPRWSDHAHLPFVQAVLMEVQRWVTIAPINLLRYTFEDSKLQGYDIPKGTVILANTWAIHHDPSGWKDHDLFVPERFLSADKKSIVKPENYIPFSYGRRSCLGEPLAVQEVFLYFTAIMQSFSVRLPVGKQADFEGVLAIAYAPKKQDLCFVLREEHGPIT